MLHYNCIMYNKSEAIHLLENSVLEDIGHLKTSIVSDLSLFKIFSNFLCLSYIKCLIVWTSINL